MDGWLERWVIDHRTQGLDGAARALAHLGTNGILHWVVFVGLVAVGVRSRRWQPVAAILGSAGVAVVGAELLKHVFDRPRPHLARWLVHASGTSMPSSVAALVAGTVTAIVLALPVDRPGRPPWRRIAIPIAAVLTIVAGASVVYVGVHWPTDVLAGWAFGVAAGVGVTWAIARFDELLVQPRLEARRSPT